MVAGTYIIPSNFLTDLTQIDEKNVTAETQLFPSHVAASVSSCQNFLHTVSTMTCIEPVRVEAGRVHADEKRMEIGKPYLVEYGKASFVITKDSKDRIHVYKFP